MYDVVVIGAGPAGLAAALVLGRCRRKVLVFDSGKPRNWASKAIHGFLTRDGTPPAEFRQIARDQLKEYPSVELRDCRVVDASRGDGHFKVLPAEGEPVFSRMLLLATGQVDVLPNVPGMEEFYGRGVFHCPYCDGWEHRDQPWAVYGAGNAAAEFVLETLCWTNDVIFCTHGPATIDATQRKKLESHRIPVIEKQIARLEGGDEGLRRLVFTDGEVINRAALFFYTRQFQRSDLPSKLGCQFDREGAVTCETPCYTGVPGLFVAGNVEEGLQLAIMAAAEGTQAAFLINTALQEADTG